MFQKLKFILFHHKIFNKNFSEMKTFLILWIKCTYLYKIMCNLGLLLFPQVTPFPSSSILEAWDSTWAKIIFPRYVNIFFKPSNEKGYCRMFLKNLTLLASQELVDLRDVWPCSRFGEIECFFFFIYFLGVRIKNSQH